MEYKTKFCQNRVYIRRLVIVFFSICYTMTSLIAEELVHTQIPNHIYAGHEFPLTIFIPGNYSQKKLAIDMPSLYPHISVTVNPSIIYNKITDATEITYTLVVHTIGIYDIDPIEIVSDNIRYVTSLITIEAPQFYEATVIDSLYWDISEIQAYVGQVIIATIYAHSSKAILYNKALDINWPDSLMIEEITAYGSIREQAHNDTDATIIKTPLALFALIAREEGMVTIPSVSISYDGNNYVIPEQNIFINAMPTQIINSRAIGAMRFSQNIQGMHRVLPNKPFTFSIRVEGIGNFPYLRMSEPEFSDGVIIDKQEEYIAYELGSTSYSGYSELRYTLRLVNEHSGYITIPSFSWYDLQTKKIIVHKKDTVKLLPIYIDNSGTMADNTAVFMPIGIDDIQWHVYLWYQNNIGLLVLFSAIGILIGAIYIHQYSRNKNYLIAFSCVSFLFMSFIVYTNFDGIRSDNPATIKLINRAYEYYNEQNYSGAYELYIAAIKEYPQSSSLLYNAAVSALYANAPSEALYFIIYALRLDGNNAQYQMVYNFLATQLPYDIVYSQWFFTLNPHILLLWSLGGLYAMLILYLCRRFMKKTFVLFLILISSLVLLLCIGFIRQWIEYQAIDGVVYADTSIKKIPHVMAEDWAEINGSSIVHILGTYTDDFYLVRTENGLQGWLLSSEILGIDDSALLLSSIEHVRPDLFFSSYQEQLRIEDIRRLAEKKEKEEIDSVEIAQRRALQEARNDTVQAPINSSEGTIRIEPIPFSPDSDGYNDAVNIHLQVAPDMSKSWKLEIYAPNDSLFRVFTGQSNPPQFIQWDGTSDTGELVQSASEYTVRLLVEGTDGKQKISEAQLPIDILVIRRGNELYMQVSSITFPSNLADLSLVSMQEKYNNNQTLDRVAKLLAAFASYKVSVSGHANVTKFYNAQEAKKEQEQELIPLSQARATAVVNALITRGISSDRLTAIGKGGSEPLVDFADIDNRWKNRRVEFVLEK